MTENNAMQKTVNNKLKILNRDIIKYIALIPMALGHYVSFCEEAHVISHSVFSVIFSNIALIAPPIFFYFIADGYRYTHSKKAYAYRLFLFALVTQVPYALLTCGDLFSLNAVRDLNILFILLMGLFSIMIWESNCKIIVRMIGVILLDAVSVLLQMEWMIFGIPLILMFHIFREDIKKRSLVFVLMIVALQFFVNGMSIYAFTSLGFWTGVLFLAIGYALRTFGYNGKRGRFPRFSKFFFYVFYPLHLFVIYMIIKIQ